MSNITEEVVEITTNFITPCRFGFIRRKVKQILLDRTCLIS